MSINDRLVPRDGDDRSIPYTHWWPKQGSTEWLTYTFPEATTIQRSVVYWYDDQPWQGCKVPDSWKLYYKDEAGIWQPVVNPDQYPDSIYDKMLSEIKRGVLDNGKVAPLTLIIKCTDEASYKNMVDALDEMTICSIGTYVIDKVSDDDQKLLDKRGIK